MYHLKRPFIRFVGVHFKLKKLQNIQDKHLEAYAAHLKSRGCSDKYVKNDLSGIRYLHRQIPQARHSLKDSKTANKEMGLGRTPDGRADRAWTERELSKTCTGKPRNLIPGMKAHPQRNTCT